MAKNVRSYLPLLAILLLAAILRLYALSSYPTGLNADEAAIGYNAYSLIQTGRDEFGRPWPFDFQSFNDWKPGLYFYLVLPAVKLFGLTEFSVRLPSAILGILTVGLTYLIAFQISQNKKIALVSAFVLAVNPWHLHFSRGGWESNAALFFLTAGVYFFLRALKSSILYPVSAILFILSMYTYQSTRLLVPLLGTCLVFFYCRAIFIKKMISTLVISGVVALILLLPLLKSFTSGSGSSRFSGVGLFADQGPLWRANELRGEHPAGSIAGVIFHNQYLEYGLRFTENYLSHFSIDYLFVSGDKLERNKVPGNGQFYLIEIVFLITGIVFVVTQKLLHKKILISWLLIAPIASSLTFQSPHAIRSLVMVVPLSIIIGIGLISTISKLANKIPSRAIYLLLVTVYLVFITRYLYSYYYLYPIKYPYAWEAGFRELVTYLAPKQDYYDCIYVTNQYDQPYILFAFYLKYPPKLFQKEARLSERDQFGFSTVERFDRYVFGKIDYNSITPDSLIVTTPNEIPNSATIVRTIYAQDGKTPIFQITGK